MRKLTLTLILLYTFFFANFANAQDMCLPLVSDGDVVASLCVERTGDDASFTWNAVFSYLLEEVTLEFDEVEVLTFNVGGETAFEVSLFTGRDLYLITSQVLLVQPNSDKLLWAYTP